jgi:hypothetical protein
VSGSKTRGLSGDATFCRATNRWRMSARKKDLAGRPLAGTRRGDATLNSCVEKDSPMSSAELAKTA